MRNLHLRKSHEGKISKAKLLGLRRLAAQVVTGIGFLGAGAIIRRGDAIVGLTTAAAISLVASIGMGVGTGYYSIILIEASLAIDVLFCLEKTVNG
jgi:putative Mg2+ transporter-C (MgtC) family protein